MNSRIATPPVVARKALGLQKALAALVARFRAGDRSRTILWIPPEATRPTHPTSASTQRCAE